jgi:hypothetical protein
MDNKIAAESKPSRPMKLELDCSEICRTKQRLVFFPSNSQFKEIDQK